MKRNIFAAFMSSQENQREQTSEIRACLQMQYVEITAQVQKVADKVDELRKEMVREIKKAAQKADKVEKDAKGLMRAQFEGGKAYNAVPPPSASPSSSSAGAAFGARARAQGDSATMVVDNFNGKDLQDDCIVWLRKELDRRGAVGVGDIVGKARRPTMI